MVSILFAALFASGAIAADVTTAVWLPGAANANQTFLGSVVEQNGDQTVLALAFASTPSTPDYFSRPPNTVTVGGTTYVAYNVSASDAAMPSAATVTIELECRRQRGSSAIPTCTLSTLGAGQVLSGVCAGLSVASLPEYCTGSNAIRYEQTETLGGESQYYVNNHPLIITAGTEKLGGSAATTTASNALARSGTESGNFGAPTPSRTASGSNSVQQATGAAAPMKSMVPALAGLGAAAAAIFL